MSATSRTFPLVSVIIPVFNGEGFIERCVDSVLAQSMQDFEIIVVNDGSTDNSLAILKGYAAEHVNVRILDQANAGQGAARNRAIVEARGEFILFVDADDFIERVTLQVATERAIEDGSDLVHFDWKLYAPDACRPGDYHYYNADPFWHRRTLVGPECDELLRVQNFYSVTKLYRRSFLNMYGIRFEEGRIYEDNPFVLQAVNKAEKASLVHSPLYTIDPRPDSSTRSGTDTDKHVRDHLYAVRRTFELLDRRNPRAAAYLAAYHVKKIGPYYEGRVPQRYRRAYVREFVEIMHEARIVVPLGTPTNAFMRFATRLQIFERKRPLLFEVTIAAKNVVMPRYKKTKRWAKSVKGRMKPAGRRNPAADAALGQPIIPGSITFLGLDHRYTGNSRYLFEEILADQRFDGVQLRFVTDDKKVETRHRLSPGLPVTDAYLARTQILIAESWIPPSIRKHKDATWLQLWHGTPLKRMLFDSHEPEIISRRRNHKTAKYKDIQSWDFLLVDSPLAAGTFETAFLFDPAKMVRRGYPRVQYLATRKDSSDFRERLRENIGVPPQSDKRIVLYAPTWRDSNYSRSADSLRFDYQLDLQALAEALGEGYVIAFHDHAYVRTALVAREDRCVDVTSHEIQELLLAADVVVSDYSSLVFDAEAVGKPVFLYAPDQLQFERDRGLYQSTWDEFTDRTFEALPELVEAITSSTEKGRVRDRYTEPLTGFLAELLKQRRDP